MEGEGLWDHPVYIVTVTKLWTRKELWKRGWAKMPMIQEPWVLRDGKVLHGAN